MLAIRTRRVDIAARRSYAMFGGVVSIVWALAAGERPWPSLVAALAVAYALTTATLAVVSWVRAPHTALLAGSLLSGTALYVTSRISDHLAPSSIDGLLLASLTLAVAILMRHPLTIILALGVPVLATEITLGLSTTTLQVLGPSVAVAAAALAVVPILSRLDERTERTATESQEVAAATAEEESLVEAHRETQRILHDDVLAALRAVGTPGTPREEALAASRSAWFALGQERVGPAAQEQLVAALREVSVPGVRLTLVSAGGDPDVVMPPPVTAALVGAVAEAARNAGRHGGVDVVDVEVSGDGEGVRVRVTDRGTGFDPASAPVSFGIRSAIRQRLADVAGEVELTSRRHQGTQVTLGWRRSDWELLTSTEEADPGEVEAVAPHTTLTASIGDPRPATAAALAPFAVLALAWAAIEVPQGQPWWLLLWAAALLALGAEVLRRGEVRDVPPWHEALHVLALGGVTAFLMSAPPGALESGAGWPISLASLAAAITATYRTGWRVVGLTAGMVCVVALYAVLSDPARSPAALLPALPALLSICWPVVVGATLRTVLMLLGERNEAESRRLRVSVARDRALRRRALTLQTRLAHLRTLLAPTLGRIAAGELDVADPAVQREARAAERSARDELHLPSAFTPALVLAVREARERGAQVVLATTSDLVHTPRSAPRLLRAALTAPLRPSAVTLTVPRDDAPVTLVAELDDPTQRAVLVDLLAAESMSVREVGSAVIARG